MLKKRKTERTSGKYRCLQKILSYFDQFFQYGSTGGPFIKLRLKKGEDQIAETYKVK